MIDTSPLYDALNHRYKGVYRHIGEGSGAKDKPWDAIAVTPVGTLLRCGQFGTPDAAARALAEYYHGVYGPNWAQALKDRARRSWRVRRIKRYPYRADLHRGPSVSVWIADVRLNMDEDTWHRITLDDIMTVTNGIVPPHFKGMWDTTNQGWETKTIAVVAIRIYRSVIHPVMECLEGECP